MAISFWQFGIWKLWVGQIFKFESFRVKFSNQQINESTLIYHRCFLSTDVHGCFPAAFSIRKGIYPARLLILKQFWYLAVGYQFGIWKFLIWKWWVGQIFKSESFRVKFSNQQINVSTPKPSKLLNPSKPTNPIPLYSFTHFPLSFRPVGAVSWYR